MYEKTIKPIESQVCSINDVNNLVPNATKTNINH